MWKYNNGNTTVSKWDADGKETQCPVEAIADWIAAGGTPLPAAGIPVEQIKSAMWEKIKESRDRRKDGGFKVGAKWFHSDQDSRIQHLGLNMAGASLPAVPWKTMDGTFSIMTPTLAGQIFQAGFALDTALFTRAEQHKAAMEASSDHASYDFSTGWPEHYGI